MARNDRGELFDLSDMSDDEVRDVVARALGEQPNLDTDWIEVDVKDGQITISGRVGTDAEVNVATNVITDVIGATNIINDLVVDESHRGQRAAGADEAAAEVEELESHVGGDSGEQSDTADHLQSNLDEEAWGTHDVQSAIRDGTSYSPPDHPTPDGYGSREEH